MRIAYNYNEYPRPESVSSWSVDYVFRLSSLAASFNGSPIHLFLSIHTKSFCRFSTFLPLLYLTMPRLGLFCLSWVQSRPLVELSARERLASNAIKSTQSITTQCTNYGAYIFRVFRGVERRDGASSSALQHSLVHDFKITIAHTYTHSNENHTSFIISAQRAFGGKGPYLLLCWTIWKRFMNGQLDGVVWFQLLERIIKTRS